MTDVPVEITPKTKPKMRLSASRMSTWMTCPLQAKFQYIDRLPRGQNAAATFGICIHAALDLFTTTQDLDAAITLFKDMWTNPEKYGLKPDSWPKGTSFGSYMSKGLNALKEYHTQGRWMKGQLIATELRFLVPFGEFELTGAVDKLDFIKDKTGHETVRITDFKTNARAPYMGNLKLNIQFSIYDYASRQPEFWTGNGPDFPGIPNGEWLYETSKDLHRQNSWYGVMQGRMYDAGERDMNDWMRLYRVAKEIEKAIEHEVFVPNISGDSCTFCPYIAPCKLPFDPSANPRY